MFKGNIFYRHFRYLNSLYTQFTSVYRVLEGIKLTSNKTDWKLVLVYGVPTRNTSSYNNLIVSNVAWARRRYRESLCWLANEARQGRVNSSDAVLDPVSVNEAVCTRRSLYKLCKRELDIRRIDIVVLCAYNCFLKRNNLTAGHKRFQSRCLSDWRIDSQSHCY